MHAVHAPMDRHVGGHRLKGIFLFLSLHCIYLYRVSHWIQSFLFWVASLVSKSTCLCLCPPPRTEITHVHGCTQFSTCAGIQTQIPVLAWKALYLQNHLPRPNTTIYKTRKAWKYTDLDIMIYSKHAKLQTQSKSGNMKLHTKENQSDSHSCSYIGRESCNLFK